MAPKAIVIAPAPIETNDTYQKYLVESSEHLLLVSRFRKGISSDFDGVDDDDDDDVEDNDVGDEEESDNNEEDEGDVDGNDNVDEVEDVKDSGIEEEKEVGYYTTVFFVWRLDECYEEGSNYAYRLTKVTSLGDQALFLGSNVSTSIASSKCIKPNCIYFTDDNVELYSQEPGGGGHDMGIFNMEDDPDLLINVRKQIIEVCSLFIWTKGRISMLFVTKV
ncbi:unnamed protein product [Fraxinus pennsylvanica]|uniref:KIB1-4 beta-propeller domain-containing protein n=1 Tax=Fraxinus pennsylvanica TaxID=56036 RepID=A0AAD1ZQW3_9LAMI|nr:unnamed protein product [Fraxinus pennsylvanica]